MFNKLTQRTLVLANILALLGSFCLGLIVNAQDSNSIGLEIPVVSQGEKRVDTRLVGNNSWVFDGELTLDDLIRYRWKSVALDTKYKAEPTAGAGYLQVYLTDDSKPENLILDFGSSPLPLSKIGSRLKDGENKILMVYVDKTGKPAVPEAKVSISFKFKNISTSPQVKVIEPLAGTVLFKDSAKDFKVELTNFSLESIDSKSINRGKVKLFINEVSDNTLLDTFENSVPVAGTNKEILSFNTRSLLLSKIPDNQDAKFIFVLVKPDGTLTQYQEEFAVKTNYNNSLKLGLPKIAILEPQSSNNNINVTPSQKFIYEVTNFDALKTRTPGQADNKSGYVQILVDDAPYKILWPGDKKEFSLDEIGFRSKTEVQKNIKIQLVNRDFSPLDNPQSDTRTVLYIPEVTQAKIDTADNSETTIKNNNWRTIIIILIVVLIVGGIAVLVTKG
jgi:hypothetical protein